MLFRSKEMKVEQALKLNEKASDVLMGFGMHCFSCPFSLMETLEEAAQAHNVDIDLMLSKLNELN